MNDPLMRNAEEVRPGDLLELKDVLRLLFQERGP